MIRALFLNFKIPYYNDCYPFNKSRICKIKYLIHASSTVYSVNTCYSLFYLLNQTVLIFNFELFGFNYFNAYVSLKLTVTLHIGWSFQNRTGASLFLVNFTIFKVGRYRLTNYLFFRANIRKSGKMLFVFMIIFLW